MNQIAAFIGAFVGAFIIGWCFSAAFITGVWWP